MATLLLEALGLAVAAPLLLSRLKNRRLVISGLILLACVLGFLALSNLASARRIERNLNQRVWYKLSRDTTGALTATIHPLTEVEGVFVSVVDFPSGTTPSSSLLQKVSWTLTDPAGARFTEVAWHQLDTIKRDDDGVPLFETNAHHLKTSLTLRVEAPQDFPWLEQVRLQVRPCWFTLKMYPLAAGYCWVRTAVCAFGFSLCVLLLTLKLRRKKQSAALAAAASS